MALITDMTLEELKKLVEDTLDERLTQMLGTFELPDERNAVNELTWDEIRASVEQRRWIPPAGAKPSLDLLREDREVSHFA